MFFDPDKRNAWAEEMSDDPMGPFHDQLLGRARHVLAPGRRRIVGRWWRGRRPAIRPGEFLAGLAMFAGGIAFGAGLVLHLEGEPAVGRPGLAIAAGMGLGVVTLLARIVVGARSNPKTLPTRP